MSVHVVAFPMQLRHGLNDRLHPMARHRHTAAERRQVHVELLLHERKHGQPRLPVTVHLTRLSPRKYDDDNLATAFKATRDAVAAWLDVNDGNAERIRFEYAWQRSDGHKVIIEIEEREA